MRMSAEVYVTLGVKVHVGNWDSKASFESLLEQAKREGMQILATKLKDAGQGVTITSEPRDMTVVLKEEK